MDEIPHITTSILAHLKEYSAKKCRIGLLRRGIKSEVPIGEFKRLEKQIFLKLAEPKPNSDFDDVMIELKKSKLEENNQEIDEIKKDLECIGKTIGNLRTKMKSMADKTFYEKWSQHVTGLSDKFTEMFSAENEDFFKKARKDTGIESINKSQDSSKSKNMKNIFYRIQSFANNTTAPYIEGEKVKMLFKSDKNFFGTGFQGENSQPIAKKLTDVKKDKENITVESINNTKKRAFSNCFNSIKPLSSRENIMKNCQSTAVSKKSRTEQSEKSKGSTDEVGNVDLNEFRSLLSEHLELE